MVTGTRAGEVFGERERIRNGKAAYQRSNTRSFAHCNVWFLDTTVFQMGWGSMDLGLPFAKVKRSHPAEEWDSHQDYPK